MIDDFVDPLQLQEYRAFAGLPYVHRVILCPDPAEAHRRNLARSGMSEYRDYIDGGRKAGTYRSTGFSESRPPRTLFRR